MKRCISDLTSSCGSSSETSEHPDHADVNPPAPTPTFACCAPRVAMAAADDYSFPAPYRGSSSGSFSSPRQCGVRFGNVDVLRFETQIDDSKLPSDGLAPLGLGELLGREHLELERYEARRRGSQRRGVGIIPPDERRASLSVRSNTGAHGPGNRLFYRSIQHSPHARCVRRCCIWARSSRWSRSRHSTPSCGTSAPCPSASTFRKSPTREYLRVSLEAIADRGGWGWG